MCPDRKSKGVAWVSFGYDLPISFRVLSMTVAVTMNSKFIAAGLQGLQDFKIATAETCGQDTEVPEIIL